MLHSKIKFATIMFNLKEKGEKLTDLGKFNNFLIRKLGCQINSREDQEWVMKNMIKRRKKHDVIISERQEDRLSTLREDNKDLAKFESLQHIIDQEIEFLMLYYTPAGKRNDEELWQMVSQFMRNEKKLKKERLKN